MVIALPRGTGSHYVMAARDLLGRVKEIEGRNGRNRRGMADQQGIYGIGGMCHLQGAPFAVGSK